MGFYAVRKGFVPGIYNSWDDCQLQVRGFSGNEFQGFATRAEAEAWLGAGWSPPQQVQQQHQQYQQFATSHHSVQQAQGRTAVFVGAEGGNDWQRGVTEYSAGRDQGLVGGTSGYDAMQRSSRNLPIFRGGPDDPEEWQARAAMVPSAWNPASGAANMPLPARASSSYANMPATAVRSAAPFGFYTLQFDGASKGNPGPAGAGALLCDPSGGVVQQLAVGLGRATNNVAEYRGLIAGLRAAVDMGIQHLMIQGDSELVCRQLEGTYQVRNEGLIPLWQEARWLMSRFTMCIIKHVERRFNSRADELANMGVHLPEEAL